MPTLFCEAYKLICLKAPVCKPFFSPFNGMDFLERFGKSPAKQQLAPGALGLIHKRGIKAGKVFGGDGGLLQEFQPLARDPLLFKTSRTVEFAPCVAGIVRVFNRYMD